MRTLLRSMERDAFQAGRLAATATVIMHSIRADYVAGETLQEAQVYK